MSATTATVDDLSGDQRSHLAWRLDHRTVCGYLTARRVARGEVLHGKTLVEVFMWAGCSPHSAKIHARKVVDWSCPRTTKPPSGEDEGIATASTRAAGADREA